MSHILDTLAGPEGDDDAYRMLIMSSMKGSPQGIRAAVAAGASCTKVYNASTPLHCAVLGVNPAKAVATLLELDPTVVDGAKFDVMPRRPTTPERRRAHLSKPVARVGHPRRERRRPRGPAAAPPRGRRHARRRAQGRRARTAGRTRRRSGSMGHFIDRACVDRREGGHTELYLRRVCVSGGFEAYKEARYGALLAAKLVARDCLHLPELADQLAGFVLPRTRVRKSMSGAARRRCECVDEANAPPCDA
jgi:hypothetical protein